MMKLEERNVMDILLSLVILFLVLLNLQLTMSICNNQSVIVDLELGIALFQQCHDKIGERESAEYFTESCNLGPCPSEPRIHYMQTQWSNYYCLSRIMFNKTGGPWLA